MNILAVNDVAIQQNRNNKSRAYSLYTHVEYSCTTLFIKHGLRYIIHFIAKCNEILSFKQSYLHICYSSIGLGLLHASCTKITEAVNNSHESHQHPNGIKCLLKLK